MRNLLPRRCGERLELGVYVLGAIGPADRSAVDAHLAGCADCRQQLAELAGLPRLLSRVASEDVDCLDRRRAVAGKQGGDSAR